MDVVSLGLAKADAKKNYAGKRTVRVTQTVSIGGSSKTGIWTDWNIRQLFALPVTTTRWRLRIRNASPVDESQGSGTVNLTGLYLGTPSFPSTGRWAGVFTATPATVYTGPSAVTGATDLILPWVTDPTQQFQAGQTHGLSFGFTGDGTTQVCYHGSGSGLIRNTGGASSLAGGSAFTSNGFISTCDLRIEYEAVIPTKVPVWIAIGDSITEGQGGGDNGPYTAFESWPGAASMRLGAPVANMGVGSTKLNQWQTGTSQFKWNRCDLATTVPDAAVLSLGTNDINAGSSLASCQGWLQTIVGLLQGLGVKQIFVCTVIPRVFGSALETVRLAYNDWVRQMPFGIAGVFDFDKMLTQPGSTFTTTSTLTATTNPITVADGSGVVVGQKVIQTAGTGALNTSTPSTVTAVSGTSVTLASAPTTSGTATLQFYTPNIAADPLLLDVYPHPRRAGYQVMAQAVRLGATIPAA